MRNLFFCSKETCLISERWKTEAMFKNNYHRNDLKFSLDKNVSISHWVREMIIVQFKRRWNITWWFRWPVTPIIDGWVAFGRQHLEKCSIRGTCILNYTQVHILLRDILLVECNSRQQWTNRVYRLIIDPNGPWLPNKLPEILSMSGTVWEYLKRLTVW